MSLASARVLRSAAKQVVLALLAPFALGAEPASVDLGFTDVERGVANSQRGQGTDGENDPERCGAPGAGREGRTNRGGTDDDTADLYMYFAVGTPAVKRSSRLEVRVTLHDAQAFAVNPATVRLEYTNAASTGPADLANTFARHPAVLTLRGSGARVRHSWAVGDAGFRTFMQGTSDFRLAFSGSRVCVDRVDVAMDPAPAAATEHLVAAHYYPWFTAGRWDYLECAAGAVRLDLAPAQPPLLGRYDSSSKAVVDQHLRWCAEHGVNVLVLEFIRPGSREDRICREVILPHTRSGDVRFSVLYDWAIRFPSFEVTGERIAAARADFDHLAREYFAHPSYLKVRGGRPLAMIYVTRALTGDVEGLIAGIREACAARGFEPFLVGDEFFFTSLPEPRRIARWDGIFGYDVYAGKGGYWETNGNLDLFRRRTAAYREAAAASGVKFFPSVAPGFNDRAIRRTCADNPVLPRRARSGAGPASLFHATFVETALREVDAELPLAVITSFNEWHEDTQIEPTRGGAAPTAADSSASGSAYTQGFDHDDYGLLFLEVVRDATLAVTGRVSGPDGPLAGAAVEVLDGEKPVLSRTSFSTGVFTVPRLRLESGRAYRLRASFPGLRARTTEPVVVLPDRTRTGIDIALTR